MRKKGNPKSFIYYDSLKQWESICMLLYSLTTMCVILTLLFAKPETKQIIIIMYAVISQLSMYFGLYTSLRNFKAYLLWFGFGIVHLILFFCFKENPALEMYAGNPSVFLSNTIVLLLLFQLLRYLSLKLQNREFVAPAKNGLDIFENKKVTLADSIIFIIYMSSWLGLTMLPLK